MKILLADDDAVARSIANDALVTLGHEVSEAPNGEEAWQQLKSGAFRFAILDWEMPSLTGPEVCQLVRDQKEGGYIYLILLTSKSKRDDLIAGLNSGADDFLAKPFDPRELRMRIASGERILELENKLEKQISDLENALDKIDKLEGMLPICSYCKKVRRDDNYWEQIEEYVSQRVTTRFSHSICPDCFEKVMEEAEEELAKTEK